MVARDAGKLWLQCFIYILFYMFIFVFFKGMLVLWMLLYTLTDSWLPWMWALMSICVIIRQQTLF